MTLDELIYDSLKEGFNYYSINVSEDDIKDLTSKSMNVYNKHKHVLKDLSPMWGGWLDHSWEDKLYKYKYGGGCKESKTGDFIAEICLIFLDFETAEVPLKIIYKYPQTEMQKYVFTTIHKFINGFYEAEEKANLWKYDKKG